MRIEVIEPSNRLQRAEILTQAFALRHRVFVEDHGWEFLRRHDGLDIDRHDDGQATHIIALDGDRLLGHARLIPGGYLVIARADPERVSETAGSNDIFGLSRFCVSPDIEDSQSRQAVTIALFQTALRCLMDMGVQTLLFETNPSIVFMLRVLGFSLENVGEATPIAGRTMQPVVLRLDSTVMSRLPLKLAAWTRRSVVVAKPA